MSAVALVNTMRIQSLRYVAHFIAVVLQVTYLYSYIKTLQLSTRSWLLSASFLSWGLFRKRNKRGREWGKGGKHFCMQLIARYFRVRDEWLFFYIYIKDENILLVVKMKNTHTLTQTLSHSPQVTGGPSASGTSTNCWDGYSVRSEARMSSHWGKNLQWNLVICKEPEWYIETGS